MSADSVLDRCWCGEMALTVQQFAATTGRPHMCRGFGTVAWESFVRAAGECFPAGMRFRTADLARKIADGAPGFHPALVGDRDANRIATALAYALRGSNGRGVSLVGRSAAGAVWAVGEAMASTVKMGRPVTARCGCGMFTSTKAGRIGHVCSAVVR